MDLIALKLYVLNISKGKEDYCNKNYCFGNTEVEGDGAYYCSKRPIHETLKKRGDSICSIWNPDKYPSNKVESLWISGKTKCASISESQRNNSTF